MKQDTQMSGLTVTLAARAEAVLLEDIISGVLAPDQRLVLPSLVKSTGFGHTPLREALSRLVRRGFVHVEANRGFRVANISPEDLADITTARIAVETSALRLCMERQDDDWIDGLVAADHRLARTARQFEGPVADHIEELDEVHRKFHYALLAGCGSNKLLEICANIYEQTDRYRRMFDVSALDPQRLIDDHRNLTELALGGDADRACAALSAHLAQIGTAFRNQ